ncbi:hypothetical protein J6590_024980 [Homalodisca vitripennis]|nr:hypothetical protein J6590_024980 [Homalodisca vitripennis]
MQYKDGGTDKKCNVTDRTRTCAIFNSDPKSDNLMKSPYIASPSPPPAHFKFAGFSRQSGPVTETQSASPLLRVSKQIEYHCAKWLPSRQKGAFAARPCCACGELFSRYTTIEQEKYIRIRSHHVAKTKKGPKVSNFYFVLLVLP